ncbi:D-lyxose/D-mannose family sugar isomerase [Streptomyces akebiae]|uniref:D-lyxose/D-mannose family sugar isomerase n=1 Tax=Streptomyces akebiae TaxID=2865673 RepID=A0ABX8XPW8_9ACTN|nr:D-lyxose/D-mannose family sugar isomerase [Streptomyces akebiae]QYX77941.1 D-lyxose/D-mannose family sugar isomerase [Streptomyces akebiae]
MHSTIVVTADGVRPGEQIRLAPGESLPFGRTERPGTPHLRTGAEGVSRRRPGDP